MAFVAGNRDSFADQDDHILDLRNGLKFLNPRMDGIALMKKIGTSGVAKSFKHEWTETQLAGRKETVTVADDSTTTLTVADAYVYQVNDLIRIENEIVQVEAIASSTTLTMERAYAGTSAAAHSSKTAIHLGSADPENSDAPAGMTDTASRLYNYVQTFTRSVDLSNDEIAQLSTEGNPFTGQLKRRFIEWWRLMASTFFYGVRFEDSAEKIRGAGGIKHFVTTNPTSVSGALTLAAIDAEILQIVNAGGDPKVLVLSPTQKQKLDALDTTSVRIGKTTKLGGSLDTQTWQSGILDHTLDVIVDHTVMTDECWILDTDFLDVVPLVHNGVDGHVGVYDASTPGKDGKKRVIRGKYTFVVQQEKAHSYLYALT